MDEDNRCTSQRNWQDKMVFLFRKFVLHQSNWMCCLWCCGFYLIHFSLDGQIFCQQNQLWLQMKILSLTLSFLCLFLPAETWYQTRLSLADQLVFQYRNLHRVFWGFQVQSQGSAEFLLLDFIFRSTLLKQMFEPLKLSPFMMSMFFAFIKCLYTPLLIAFNGISLYIPPFSILIEM